MLSILQLDGTVDLVLEVGEVYQDDYIIDFIDTIDSGYKTKLKIVTVLFPSITLKNQKQNPKVLNIKLSKKSDNVKCSSYCYL